MPSGEATKLANLLNRLKQRVGRFFSGIAFRISMSIAVVIAATTISVAWFILNEEKNVLEIELRDKGLYLIRFIAQQLAEPLLYEDRYSMYALLQSSLVEEKGIVLFAEVYGQQGELIVMTHEQRLKTKVLDDSLIANIRSPIVTEDTLAQTYDILSTIDAKGLGTVGYLRLTITKRFLLESLAATRSKLYLFSAVILLSGIITGLWMARKIIRPVLILNEGVKKVAGGELGVEVEIVGEGEIRELSVAFNNMSRRLKESADAIRAAQENLIRTEKLYALGEFSAGLAHEIKNPLTSIKMLIQTAKERENNIPSGDIVVVEDEINRIDRIVKDFLAFARNDAAELHYLDLNEILRDVIALVRIKIEKSDIRLIEHLDPHMPKVRLHPDGIKQVFLNVFLNAIQAMKGGGVLTVSTFVDDSPHLVSVSVTDTGHGIPQQLINKIFDPFFTTKEEGTGMGLAVAYNIVKKHQGTIEVASRIDEGTNVTVSFPIRQTADLEMPAKPS